MPIFEFSPEGLERLPDDLRRMYMELDGLLK